MLEGKFEVKTPEEKVIVPAGDSYFIDLNQEHSETALEDSLILFVQDKD